jgi:hypothetical protein
MRFYRITEAVGEIHGPFRAANPIDALNILAQNDGHESHVASCEHHSRACGFTVEPGDWTTDPDSFARGDYGTLVEEVLL